MRITVLTVPDCPNAPVVRERITTALDGRAVQVELVEVTEDAEAARWGMTGSPTVLLDGVDPFAAAGAVSSVSCRLYRDEDGRIEGAPSVTALRDALAGAGAGMECCETHVLTGRTRVVLKPPMPIHRRCLQVLCEGGPTLTKH